MKLHLPNGLRKAVMACMAAVATLTTTIGTGIIAGGAVTYMLAAVPQAHAAYEWKTNSSGDTPLTIEDWDNENNWTLTDGSSWQLDDPNASPEDIAESLLHGPGAPSSGKWDEIVLTGNGSADSLVFGTADSRITLEGWTPKYNLSKGATLYADFAKFQGDNKYININSNSTFNVLHSNRSGTDNGTMAVNVGAGSTFTLILGKNDGNGVPTGLSGTHITINLNDSAATLNISSADENRRYINNLTLNEAFVFEGDAGVISKITGKGNIDVNKVSIKHLYLGNEHVVLSDEAITEDNVSTHQGCIWFADDGIYYVKRSGAQDIYFEVNIAYDQNDTYGYNVRNGATLSINNGNGGAGNAAKNQSYGYGDISLVGDGSTLSLQLYGTSAASVKTVNDNDKAIIDSAVTMGAGSILHIEDGSYYFSKNIVVNGSAQIETRWAKGNVFSAINKGDATTADSILTVRGPNSEGGNNMFSFNSAGNYNGKVEFANGGAGATNYFVMNHEDAFASAAVNTGNDGNKNKFALNVSTVNIRALSGNAEINLYGTGLNSDGAGHSAATLNVSSAKGDFSGTIAEGITLKVLGGTQGISGGTYNGVVEVGAAGTLEVSGNITLAHAVENAGTVDVRGVTELVLGSAITDAGVTTDKVTTYTVIKGGSVTGLETMDSDALKGAIVSDALNQLGTTWSFANGVLTVELTTEDLTWSGGDLTWKDEAVLDNGGVFDQGDSVTFQTAEPLTATATLAENITALNVKVDAATTLTIDGGENKLTVVETLTNDGTLTLDSGTYDLKEVTNNGIINLGTVTISGNETSGTINGNPKTTCIGGTVNITGAVTIVGDKRVDIGDYEMAVLGLCKMVLPLIEQRREHSTLAVSWLLPKMLQLRLLP